MAERYVYRAGAKQFGPITKEQMLMLASLNKIDRTTPVRSEGGTEWRDAWTWEFLQHEWSDPGTDAPQAPRTEATLDDNHPAAPIVRELQQHRAIMAAINGKLTFFVWVTAVSMAVLAIWILVVLFSATEKAD